MLTFVSTVFSTGIFKIVLKNHILPESTLDDWEGNITQAYLLLVYTWLWMSLISTIIFFTIPYPLGFLSVCIKWIGTNVSHTKIPPGNSWT